MVFNKSRILPLDGIRGFAVLLVFCVHQFGNAANYLGRTFNDPVREMDATSLILLWLTNSNYGVYLFFVLSGFLIGRMMIAPTRLTYGTFIARRFARIYPAFLLSLLAGALVTIFITKLVGFSWTVLAQNLLFLNGWFAIGEVPSYNFVTWSLFFEFVFYLTIPAVWLLPSRPAWQILGGLLITSVTAIVLQLGPTYLYFFAGLVVANISDQRLQTIAERIPTSVVLVAHLAITTLYAFRISGHDYVRVPLHDRRHCNDCQRRVRQRAPAPGLQLQAAPRAGDHLIFVLLAARAGGDLRLYALLAIRPAGRMAKVDRDRSRNAGELRPVDRGRLTTLLGCGAALFSGNNRSQRLAAAPSKLVQAP